MERIRIFPRRARHAAVAVLIAGVFAACGGGTSVPSASGAPAAAIGGSGPVVNLKSLKFSPKKLEIKVGQTVTWVWREKVAHNVVFKDKVKSKLTPKGPYSRTFDKAGKYRYTCTIHPGMDGEVTVK